MEKMIKIISFNQHHNKNSKLTLSSPSTINIIYYGDKDYK